MAASSSLRSARPRTLFIAALALLLVLAVSTLSTTAYAQDGTEPAGASDAQADQPEDAADEEGDDGLVGALDLSGEQTFVIAAILLTAAGIFVAYLVVANNGQREAYRAIERLGRRGIATRVEHVDAWRPVSGLRQRDGTDGGGQATQDITFTVAAPDRLVVGSPVDATATVTGVENPEVTWSASDPALEVSPQGLGARVTGTKPGLYILTAVLTGHLDHTKPIPIEVAEARAEASAAGVAVPFTNAGIATFGVLMFLLALLATLGVAQVIDGDLLMTVITTVVGGLIGAGAVAATKETG